MNDLIDLVIQDMEKLSKDPAPWVSIAAVKFWHEILIKVKKENENED